MTDHDDPPDGRFSRAERQRPALAGMALLVVFAVIVVGILMVTTQRTGFSSAEMDPASKAWSELAALHQGPGPCLRYPNLDDLEGEDLAQAARVLVEAGLRDRWEVGAPLMRVWALDAEESAHAASAFDEYWDHLMGDAPLLERLRRRALAYPQAKKAFEREEEVTRRLADDHDLSEEEVEALRLAWEHEPRLSHPDGLSRLQTQVIPGTR